MTRPNFIKELRDALVADSTLTALVPANSINVSWKKADIGFPNVIISQIDGRAIGGMGCGVSPVGSRMVTETPTFRIDIASRSNITNLINIEDAIMGVLIPLGYEKMGDSIDYDSEDKEVYIRTMRFKILSKYDF